MTRADSSGAVGTDAPGERQPRGGEFQLGAGACAGGGTPGFHVPVEAVIPGGSG